jgi:poly(A) polymerase
MRRVDDLVANHMRFKDVDKMRESTILKFLRLPHFDEHLELHRLDCLASHGNLDHYEFMKARWERTPPEVLKPPPLVTGDDLVAAGYRPGPLFRKALSAAEDAQLEGRARTRAEALLIAIEEIRAN